MRRTPVRKLADFVTFPLRAISLFYEDQFGLSSLASERFDYVAAEVTGYCLDVGCGRHNRFIREFMSGNGEGIDVFPYEGLERANLLDNPAKFPYPDGSFDSITFIACANHIPERLRDAEFAEAHRVLKPGGKIVVTMGNPLAEVIVHKLVWLYDRVLGTSLDVDSERGMEHDEALFLTDAEIKQRLKRAGFLRLQKRHFLTQWGLNHLLVGWK